MKKTFLQGGDGGDPCPLREDGSVPEGGGCGCARAGGGGYCLHEVDSMCTSLKI